MTVKGGTSQACAVCKYQRRRCHKECPLAPYFPGDQPTMFRNAHRLFGVSNITKILNKVPPDLRQEAMQSIKFESDMRAQFPVHGCCGIIRRLLYQLHQVMEQLRYVHVQIALCRDHQASPASPSYYSAPSPDPSPASPSRQLQLGSMIPGEVDAIPANKQPFPMLSHSLFMNEDPMKPSTSSQQLPYNYEFENISQMPPVQVQPHSASTMLPEFLTNYGGEVFMYDDMPFDTITIDRQSYVESRDNCESSAESSFSFRDMTQSIDHITNNELKSAAAGLTLKSVRS